MINVILINPKLIEELESLATSLAGPDQDTDPKRRNVTKLPIEETRFVRTPWCYEVVRSNWEFGTPHLYTDYIFEA